MALTLFTGPTADPVSLADIRAHLRIDHTLDDEALLAYLNAARLELEGKDGWLNRAFITQTWDWRLDAFPCSASRDYLAAYDFVVPLPPLQSVTSIKYIDPAGTEQTLASTEYDVDAKSEPGRIRPAYGKTWPSIRYVPNAVTVRFIAGYGAGTAAIPGPIRLALIGRTGDFYTNRDTQAPVPAWIEALLASYRVWTY